MQRETSNKILLLLAFASMIANGASDSATGVILMNETLPELLGASFATPLRTKVVRILTSITYSGIVPLGPTATVSQQMAIDWLHNQPNWLPGYRLEFELIDDQSDDSAYVSGLLDKFRFNDVQEARFPLVGMIEFSIWSLMLSAYLMKPYNMIGVNIYPLPDIYFDRHKFQNYFPFGERQDYYMISEAMFIAKMGWRRVAMLTDTNSYNAKMESFHLTNLEANNITLLYIGKFLENTENEYELDSTFSGLKSRDPRIIMNCAVNSATVACYLHKYGLYGPSYVIIGYSWTSFDENSQIPEFVSSWCTPKMLIDILASSIFFGDAPLADVYGADHLDSTGRTRQGFIEQVKSSVDKPDQAVSLEYWDPAYYDRGIILGTILNETENVLNQQNMTLLDWVTNSENYRQNPNFILEIIKNSVYKTNLTGIKGEWSYDRASNWPSGCMPIVYTQTRIINGNQSFQEPIGYYKSNRAGEKTVIHWQKLKWNTLDHSTPKDHLFVVEVEAPLIPTFVNAILYSLAIAVIICIVGTLLVMAKRITHPETPRPFRCRDLVMLVSDAVMVSEIFALPFYGSHGKMSTNCGVMGVLMLAGFSCLIAAISEKLRMSLAAISSHQTKNPRRPSKTVPSSLSTFSHVLLAIVLAITPPILLIATIISSPIKTLKTKLQLEMSKRDESLAFLFQREECQFENTLFGTTASVAMVSLSALFLLFSLLRATMLAFKAQSLLKKRVPSANLAILADMKQESIFVYGLLIFLFGGAFIGILLGSQNSSMTILTSVLVLLIASINVVLCMASLYWKPDATSRVSDLTMSSIRASHFRSPTLRENDIVSRRSSFIPPSTAKSRH